MSAVRVPDGCTVTDVLDALRHLVERHDSLHSLYLEQAGVELQRVLDRGELEVDLYPLADGDALAQGQALGAVLRRELFDPATDLPLRAAVLTAGDQPRAIVLTACHMAVDGWSFQIVLQDLRRLLDEPTGATLMPPAQQPVARAAYEQTPAARRREERALTFWEQNIRTLPSAMLSEVVTNEPVPLRWAQIESRAMALAIASLSAQARVSSSVTFLAAITMLLALHTSEQSAAVRVIVATRFKTENERLVGAFNQNALFRMDLADESIGDFLRRAASSAASAYRSSEYNPRSLESMVQRVATERGIEAGGYCYVNDVRYELYGEADAEAPADVAAEIRDAMPGSVLVDLEDTRIQKGSKFFIYLRGGPQRSIVQLSAHPHFLAPNSPADFLSDLEWMLTTAACDNPSIGELRKQWSQRHPGRPGCDSD
ncbi:condensation domain-containing protein [Dactylosporangium sp. NPDC051484]|uniref:condensation domain-containing protein n=1 Tax=Dactylosporangium sp. NPDC051484 TaxID=3154942 RepID=UPI00344E3C80